MPDSRRHRGPHPSDAMLFGRDDSMQTLRMAAGDFAWLLGRHYAQQAALTLVGNRYQLHRRQRLALSRAVAPPRVARMRRCHQVDACALRGVLLQVDALNQLITIEAALAGALLLRGHDGALRDLASVHGTYRLVRESMVSLEAIGTYLALCKVQGVEFLIDAAVSNSGRLASRIRGLGERQSWPWCARLVADPDPILQRTTHVIATSDSVILDYAAHWFDLASAVIARVVPHAWCLDLDVAPPAVD
jgi:hypothetical protein